MAKAVKDTEDTNLATFEWDDAESMEFFGQKPETDDTVLTEEEKEKIKTEVVNEEETEEEEATKKKPKKVETEEETEETEEEEVEFFKEEETTEETQEGEETVEKSDDFFSVLATEMKEQGIFSSVEVPEGETISQEQFIELQEAEVENRVTETFEGFFEEMDDDGKAFLKFKKEGGKTSDFLATLKDVSGYPTGDIEDNSFQNKALKYYYKNIENLDDDDIDDKLEWLEEGGKKEKYAKRYYKKIKDIEKAEKQAIIKKQEKITEAEEKRTTQFRTDLKSKLEETDTIKNFPITKKEKSELLNYITKPSVKVGKNNYITEFQEGLKNLSNNHEGLILLAKLIKSDFDVSSIKTKETTKQVRKLKNNLQRTKKEVKPTNSGSSGKKSLSEFF